MTGNTLILTARWSSLILSCVPGEPLRVVHWGRSVDRESIEGLSILTDRQRVFGCADVDVSPTFLNEVGNGLAAPSGFSAHRNGRDWQTCFTVKGVEEAKSQGPQGLQSLRIVTADDTTQIEAIHILTLSEVSGVLTVQTQIINRGDEPLCVDQCAAAVLPLPHDMDRVMTFTGRWAAEFQAQETPIYQGRIVRENWHGRTGHDTFPALIAASATTCEARGDCYGLHLGWSGNHRLSIEQLNGGQTLAQMGELFFPGEIILAPGEVYDTPALHAAYSHDGLNGLSDRFHSHVLNEVMDGRLHRKPRPVHYNTWEAVYFDHTPQTLMTLAQRAADIGVERFILDDGWFGGRRSDAAGLGDWWVSEETYPDGLAPLIDHVEALGMEFGLWFEPEMVNPDSDLFRAHPDWILGPPPGEQVPFRGQLVLDLTRPEVSDYLFERLDALLSDLSIAYIKWDMNRDLNHPESAGRAVVHRQTRAVYALVDRLRAAHPDIEVEACASGGGRADYGMLARADRIWTSDSNDALDRQHIQRGASYFLPNAVLGAHVGPAKCHITGRRLPIELRIASAFFGHMGLELNLLQAKTRDLEALQAGIALHKQHRALLHTGRLLRLEADAHAVAMAVIAPDAAEQLLSWCQMTESVATHPPRLRFPGLAPGAAYRVRVIWPMGAETLTEPSILTTGRLTGVGSVFPADLLSNVGLQLPKLFPETCLIFYLKREDMVADGPR